MEVGCESWAESATDLELLSEEDAGCWLSTGASCAIAGSASTAASGNVYST